MEQLIEFLFKYWYIAIIVLTFFYQLRNKWVNSTKGETKAQGMPSFGGNSANASKPARPPGASQPSKRPLSSTMLQNRQESENTQSITIENNDTQSKESPFSSSASSKGLSFPMNAGVQSSQRQEQLSIQPSQQQIAQGIVWAEILGPPRSKKPYRR